MFKVNEYFNGRVMSIAFSPKDAPATLGVMAIGDYEFKTDKPEVMHVVSGALVVKLPGASQWETFQAGSRFDVPGSSSFQVRVEQEAAYLCEYH